MNRWFFRSIFKIRDLLHRRASTGPLNHSSKHGREHTNPLPQVENHQDNLVGRLLNNILSKSYAIGFLSLLWLIFRSGTRPDRLRYPCQKVALSNSAIFIGSLGVSMAVPEKWGKIKNLIALRKLALLTLLITVFFLIQDTFGGYTQTTLESSAHIIGLVNGQESSRVVRVHDSGATDWDFSSPFYWQHVDQAVVDRMVEEGVITLTGTSSAVEAWGEIMMEYDPGETVAIKINCNDCWNANQNEIDSLPQVINAVIRGLKSIGVPETDIRVIEPTEGPNPRRRILYQYYYDNIYALYPDVSILDGNDSTYIEGGNSAIVDYADPGIADDRITDLIVSADHLINLPIMKAIFLPWGVSGAIKNHQGSIQRPSVNHDSIANINNNPLIDIYKNTHITSKTRLIVSDGLFGTWTGIHFSGAGEEDDVPNPWVIFNNNAPNSLFFSTDPVAMDSVMQDIINAERSDRGLPNMSDPPLHAAANAELGIHEHGTLPPGEQPPNFVYLSIDLLTVDLDLLNIFLYLPIVLNQ